MVATDPTRRQHDCRTTKLELADGIAIAAGAAYDIARRESGTAHANDGVTLHDQVIDPMPEPEFESPILLRLTSARNEGRQHTRSRPPGYVKSGYRIASAFRTADYREPADAKLVQPGAFLASRELQVRFRPLLWPMILGPIESSGACPVFAGAVDRIPDTQSALLGRIHQEQPAERPVSLPAEALLWFLVDDDDALSSRGDLRCGYEPRKASPNDDRVGHSARLRMWSASGRSFVIRNWRASSGMSCSASARSMHQSHSSRSCAPIENGRCRARSIGWP